MTPFDAAPAGNSCWLVDCAGQRHRLPAYWWGAEPDPADEELLARCTGPTIDVGCDPGRLAAALTARGTVALGVDVSPLAVRLSTQRGAASLRRDVFGRLPGEGRWAHVLLADGNIGIGGSPPDLLRRCAELASRHGSVLVELDPLATGVRRCLASVEHDRGTSEQFRWAVVGADAAGELAESAGLRVTDIWRVDGRAFVELSRAFVELR